MKKVLMTQKNDHGHWVGDGFPVRSIFSYRDLGREMTPFLLMDYAGPATFPANSNHRRGVGEHPHRGFETVTIVYSGEVEHRDSSGGGGVIKDGDVQWMTAASGLVHEEFHGENFARDGGLFEMVQLWVNLPSKDKMNKPRYQGLTKENIPVVEFDGGYLRVIAGEYDNANGPALTHTPINLWDIRLKAGSEKTFKVPAGHSASVFLLSGKATISDSKTITDAEIAILDTDGDTFTIRAEEDSKLLFMGGEPIMEPIVGHGPFVMNTQKEIWEAMADYQNGKMGQLN